MLKHHLPKWTSHSSLFPHPTPCSCTAPAPSSVYAVDAPVYPYSAPLKIKVWRGLGTPCRARRRVVYKNEEADEDDEHGYNEEIAILEAYTQLKKDEVLLVHVAMDNERVEVLIFKGFSSCLSYKTSSDPSRSVVPAKAVIKSIDRVRGPFDPSNIQYIEKGLTFDAFKNQSKKDTISG